MGPPWDGLPVHYRPKHKIFLSIDAIGSTQLKSSLASLGCTPDVWATHFLAFLPEVEVIFCNTFSEIISRYCPHGDCGKKCIPLSPEETGNYSKPARVWKYIGDEVVLTADLTCPDYHPALYVVALAETLKKLNNSFQQNPICIERNTHYEFYLQFRLYGH